MKAPQNAEPYADKAGLSQPGHGTESEPLDIKEPQEPNTSVIGARPHPWDRSIHWSKTIEVIYFDKPQVRSTYSLHQYFISRPKQEVKSDDKPMDRDQEEVHSEERQSDQKESVRGS